MAPSLMCLRVNMRRRCKRRSFRSRIQWFESTVFCRAHREFEGFQNDYGFPGEIESGKGGSPRLSRIFNESIGVRKRGGEKGSLSLFQIWKRTEA